MDNKQYTFPEWHIYDLKKATAEFLTDRLAAFEEWIVTGKTMSLPDWVVDDYSEEKYTAADLNRLWAAIIREMREGFACFGGESDLTLSWDEQNRRKERALILFQKYFIHLWD